MSIVLGPLLFICVIAWIFDRERLDDALDVSRQNEQDLRDEVAALRRKEASARTTIHYPDSFAADSPARRAVKAAQTIKTKAATARSRKAKK